MSLTGWVATHTGLPSFHVVGSGDLLAEHEALGWSRPRLVARVQGEALVSDPGAGEGTPTEYRFGFDSVTLTRRGVSASSDVGHQWVTSADGQLLAGVKLVGDDPREYDTGATIFTSALGRQIPRFPLGQKPSTGTLTVLSTLAATEVLREMTVLRAPLWVVHNASACEIPGCDIEGARLIVPQRMRESRTGRVDRATREWAIDYSRVPDALAGSDVAPASGVPVVTWGDWEAWSKANSPKGWQSWSALQVATRVAGMP